MKVFWPNFDVGKEQVRNTKRDNSQTDAENPYKIVMVTKHNVHLRHRKEGNECRKRLETDASPQKHLGDFGRLHVWSSQGASFAESGLGDFLRVGFGFDVSRGRFSISVLVKSRPPKPTSGHLDLPSCLFRRPEVDSEFAFAGVSTGWTNAARSRRAEVGAMGDRTKERVTGALAPRVA